MMAAAFFQGSQKKWLYRQKWFGFIPPDGLKFNVINPAAEWPVATGKERLAGRSALNHESVARCPPIAGPLQ
jgi:hypothetical protein